MTTLSGEQRKKIRQGLLSAYPSIPKLKIMVDDELNRNLDAIAGGSNLEEVVFYLINAAIEANPGNEDLRVIAQELLPNPPENLPVFPSNVSYNLDCKLDPIARNSNLEEAIIVN